MQTLTGNEIKMIDVSHYDGSVDWQKVAATGIKAAYIKVTEGTDIVDNTFDGHVHWATTFGIACGAYHFAHPELNQNPIVEADHFLNTINGHSFTLMPVLDYESPAKQYPLSPKYMSDWARNFVNYVQQKTGQTVMIYTGKWFVDMYGIYGLDNQPLWASRYATIPPADFGGWKQWTAWQYTDSEYVNGVGNCDVSYAISLAALRGGNQQQQEPPISFGALGVVTVTADLLNLRKGPSTSYDIIRTLGKGETYLWYGEQDGFGNLGGGWASMSYLSYKPGTAVVTADALNVRIGPGTGYNICDVVHKGDTLPVWGTSGNWVNVGDVNGHQRWVHGQYVNITP